MQMLQAGGMPVLSDGARTADADNPRGYLEFEAAKNLRSDSSWLAQAEGKAVKIIHALLADLPTDRSYRVVFLRRDLHEVVRSQRAMLERSGRAGAALPAERLIAVFESQRRAAEQWMAERDCFRVLVIDYAEIIAQPLRQSQRIATFLDKALDEHAMAGAVDTSLYRNRSDSR